MKRRDVLRRTCGALAVGATAGCLSSDGGEGDGGNETDATETTAGTDAAVGAGNDTAAGTEDPTTRQGTKREESDGSGESIETTRTDCRSGDDADAASVSFGEGEVGITGSVIVADPCHAAAFGAVERRDDELVVVVEPADDGNACMQCEGVVDYAASIAVDDPPATVTVKHRSQGRTRTVETASA
ncbi:hypothetical protein [Halostella litorea]|uniref:hypothetical protein n=1 Tax=Halostella litorea TaxID=2528831 RepID=UPI00109232B3|nr:hypothetical protein [Halostella litorea]